MILTKIKVKNYRLLKEFELDLEDILSLVIGKNNCGKTSLLSILEKTIGDKSSRNTFTFDDFNIDFKEELKTLIENTVEESDYNFTGLSLKLFIKYDDKDDLTNISRLMMDLNPANNIVVLAFEYGLSFDKYLELKADFKSFKTKQAAKKRSEEKVEGSKVIVEKKDISYFLKNNHKKFFKLVEKAIEYNIDDPKKPFENDKNFIDLTNSKEHFSIDKLINFQRITAKREVSNKDPNKSLSSLSSQIYKRQETNDSELEAIDEFKDALSDTDIKLDTIYAKLFDNVISKVELFGGIKQGESIIEIISTLEDRELLEGNTTVMYRHNETNSLPEHYNGLGYMNLISMIFEIEILLQKFKKDKTEKPADINLLFIEEPEAHTHPQMQNIFIKNIKTLLARGIEREDGEKRKLQTIISTHSSHIVSESQFDDIKYLKRGNKSVVAKNLRDLINEYSLQPKQYHFLKQYLTISRAELFFADKVILIEGDTERILIPTIMKKLDVEYDLKCKKDNLKPTEIPLLSQNISIIEVGAYSQIFEQFIDFLGIKSLIITDFDSVDKNNEACPVSDGVDYSNGAISFFLNKPIFADLKSLKFEQKTLTKTTKWVSAKDGKVCIVFQIEENGYHARSFEDAFIHLNRSFVKSNKDSFKGIKNSGYFDNDDNSPYILARDCIKKKTHFALDILYFSDSNYANWDIPAYIKEGLAWLKKD